MSRLKGIILIIVGSILWGLSGPMMEWVFGVTKMSVPFLLTIRLTVAGVLLLSFSLLAKKDIFAVWKSFPSAMQLILFSIIGVLGLQYAFLGAIDASNSVVATLFQFSAPIIVVSYISLKMKELPPRNQVIGIIGTLIGLFLLLTNGTLDSLLVSTKAIVFGIGLGFTYAFYTLYPTRLMKEWGILIILGWGMFIGGSVIGVAIQIWNSNEWVFFARVDITLMTIALIIFGTIAYAFFLASLSYISAVETSILSSVEPLTVMIVSVIWFGKTLENVQLIGVVLMLLFVTLLSLSGKKSEKMVIN